MLDDAMLIGYKTCQKYVDNPEKIKISLKLLNDQDQLKKGISFSLG